MLLVDGYVAGTWRLDRASGSTMLLVEPFAPLAPGTLAELAEEGMRLLAFAAPHAAGTMVVAEPSAP